MEKNSTAVKVTYSKEIETELEQMREEALKRSRESYNSAAIAVFNKRGN